MATNKKNIKNERNNNPQKSRNVKKTKHSFSKRTVRYVGILIAILAIVLIIIVAFPSQKQLQDYVPDASTNQYIKEASNNERSLQLMSELSAIEALVVTYGVQGLDNSYSRLELLRYSPDLYVSYLNNHLASETIKLGGVDVQLPCSTFLLDNTEVKSCIYSSESVQVVKYTFAISPDVVVRVLCTEGDETAAEIHCREIATGVLQRK